MKRWIVASIDCRRGLEESRLGSSLRSPLVREARVADDLRVFWHPQTLEIGWKKVRQLVPSRTYFKYIPCFLRGV